MLIKCPECELQISDKALSCPHCGFPMKGQKLKGKYKSTSKHKRLPNGFGQISEIKDPNLRNPYRAMVTVGKNSKGRPICKPLKPKAYFRTYNEAYEALVEYNKNPYDLDAAITLKELYDKWSEEYFKTLANDSSKRTVTSAWNYCSTIYDMRVKDIRARHIKGIMEEGQANVRGKLKSPSAGTKSRIKSLFNLMLDYAVEYEIVDRNYARTFELSKDTFVEMEETKRSHIPFTESEVKTLWENINTIPYVNVLLIQCYMGWRPQELGLLRTSEVDLSNNFIYGGMKTDFGKHRAVPIHECIQPMIKALYDDAVKSGSEYLIKCYDSKIGDKLTYDKYAGRYKNIIEILDLNPDHRPHDPRKHFVTMCKKANVDEYAIKYMVGHEIQDITEKVYTERELSWLTTELAKINVGVSM